MSQNNKSLIKVPKKSTVILICNTTERESIEKELKDSFDIRFQTDYQRIQHTYRTKHIDAIVSCISKEGCSIFELIKIVCERSPSLLKIAVIPDSNDIELIRRCGELGFDKVILTSQLGTLYITIRELTIKKSRNVTLVELGIEIKGLHELIQKALSIIEQDYLTLRFVEDIANRLGVSYSLLAFAIQKSPLCNLKKILLYFKIRHSLQLLKDNNLSIQEISALCGFTNEKRFREGMKRLILKNPSECQKELQTVSIDKFWESNVSMNYCVK